MVTEYPGDVVHLRANHSTDVSQRRFSPPAGGNENDCGLVVRQNPAAPTTQQTPAYLPSENARSVMVVLCIHSRNVPADVAGIAGIPTRSSPASARFVNGLVGGYSGYACRQRTVIPGKVVAATEPATAL